MLDVFVEAVFASSPWAIPQCLAALVCAVCAAYVARNAQKTRLAILLPVVLGSMAVLLAARALVAFGGDAAVAREAASWSFAALTLTVAAGVQLSWQLLGKARERKLLLVLLYVGCGSLALAELWSGAAISGLGLLQGVKHVGHSAEFSDFGVVACSALLVIVAAMFVELCITYQRFSARGYSVTLPKQLIALTFCAMLGFFDLLTIFADSPYQVAWFFLPIYAVCFSRIVSRHKALDLPSADVLDQSLAALRDGLLFLDRNGEVVYASPKAESLLGIKQGDAIGRPVDQLSEVMLPPSLVNVWLKVGRPARTKIEMETGEGLRSVEVGFRPLVKNGAQHAGFSISFTDNSQWSRQSQQWRDSAMRDPLTKLSNRRGFSERLRLALANNVGEANENIVVFLLDLDGFKPVNDTYGHKAGDEVLRVTAERLQRVVKAEDTVARLGGDEFAIIALDVRTRTGLGSLLSRLQRVFEMPVRIGTDEILVGASIGVAVATDPTVDAEQLVDSADRDMYRSKLRNRRYQSSVPDTADDATEIGNPARLRSVRLVGKGSDQLGDNDNIVPVGSA